ncbi:MAG: ATP phosphoribosyltransferase regulatory subunit [Nannocystales bacterium]
MRGPHGTDSGIDLLPRAAARRRALVDALLGSFAAWGYRQVVTPTVERYEVLAAGLSEADRAHVVRFVSGPASQVVALRSDVTPQIARMVAHHRGTTWPADAVLRLAYTADVVRQPADTREKTEQHQVGVEFVGDASPAADAELVGLAHAALQSVGLRGFRFDMSHRGIAHRVLDGLGLDSDDRQAVEARLARKDRGGLEALLLGKGVAPAQATAVGSLCDAYGRPEVIEQRTELAGEGAGLRTLAAIVEHVRAASPQAAELLDVDLGEVRGFDYYTGTRLRAWAPGVAAPVLRGGRYDDLVGRFGEGAPATGFALDLDALQEALGERGPAGQGRSGRLLALHPDCAPAARIEASRQAAAARAAGERAWIHSGLSLKDAQVVALDAEADALTYLQPDEAGGVAALRFRRVQDTPSNWTRE